MIASLYFRHFKAFQEAHDIELRPLTLIYGSNSSGKSSLLQALLLLKQTLEPSVAGATVLQFRSEDYVDLGNFANVVYAHRKSEPLVIGLTCRTADVVIGQLEGVAEFSARFYFVVGRDNDVVLQKIDIFLNREEASTFSLVARVTQGSADAASVDEIQPRRLRRRRRFEVAGINASSPFIRGLFDKFVSTQLPRAQTRLSSEIDLYNRFAILEAGDETPHARYLNQLHSHQAYLSNYSFQNYLNDLLAESTSRAFDLYHFFAKQPNLSQPER